MNATLLTGRMHRLLPEVIARIGQAYGFGLSLVILQVYHAVALQLAQG